MSFLPASEYYDQVVIDRLETVSHDDPRQVMWFEMIRSLAQRSENRNRLRTEEELKALDNPDSQEGPVDHLELTELKREDTISELPALPVSPLHSTPVERSASEPVPSYPSEATTFVY
jgi:hypothetical protein